MQHHAFVTDLDGDSDNRVRIYVPLPCIFPCLWELNNDGAIYTGFD